VKTDLTKETDDAKRARTARRGKHIKLTVFTGLVARASSMLMAIVSVPLTLNYLGAERFGLWMTVTSVISMLTFADLGIGNGLLTVIAEASGRDDQIAIRRFVSSGFAILTLIATCILLLFFVIVYPALDWARLFNVVSPSAIAEAGPAIAALIACIVASISTLLVPRVQLALQHGFISNLFVTLGLFASLAAVWLVSVERGSVALLILAMSGTPVIASIINGLIFFNRNRQYRPSLSLVSKPAMRRILSTGVMFVVLQLSLALSFASDKLIIAHLLGATAVASYSVYERVFGVGTNLMLSMLVPIWPAYAEAWARKDRGWVKRALTRSLAISLAGSVVFAVSIIFFGSLIVSLWTRKDVSVEPIVLYCLGAWCVIQCTVNALSMLLNGLHLIRVQVTVSVLTASMAIPLKFVLIAHLGPAGGVLASSIAAVCFTLVPYVIVVWRLKQPTR